MSAVAYAVEAPPSLAQQRLLIVEDDPHSASLIQALLEARDPGRFLVRHATTIREACAAVSTLATDIVVLDLGLPDSQDLDTLTRLQECVRETPIIVLTGKSDDHLATAALRSGAEDYLIKGEVTGEILLRSIRYAIERHKAVRALGRVTRELQIANATLERLTLLDPLTDLLNRRGLQQALSREIHNLQRAENPVIVVLVDVDDFKTVNESLGHSVGDIALKEVAARLRGCVRGGDYVGRFGGDEFLLILPNANVLEVTKIAERVRLSIATTTITHGNVTLRLTASLGVRLLTPDTPSVDELLGRMQQLLYRSKREGKNRISYDELQFETDSRSHTGDICSDLLEGRNLITVKQTIYRLSDEQPVAYEFLSRYRNGRLEMPDNFFRMCSERNILTIVDHQCLRSAISSASALDESARFHVNLFPTTMIAVPPEHLIEEFPRPMRSFCVEISEQQIIGNPSHLLASVAALREAGVLIAIDDVGFGNSCLESLVILQPDIIKIDKRCVMGLTASDVRSLHLRRYVNLARILDAELIAEGIETKSELELVREHGIEYGQGFYWGMPD